MSQGSFKLLFSGRIKESLQRLEQAASAAGLKDMVGQSLTEIEGHLELDPRGWGDPLRHLKHFRQTIYRRIHDSLKVEYSVHDAEPYVWLTRVVPVLDHPLNKDADSE
jgi:hypothetical protein